MTAHLVSRRGLALVLAWALSLLAVGAWSTATAQRSSDEPRVFSGNDLGFRVDSVGKGGVRVGALVVRIEGKWVETELSPKMRMRPAR
jgi:hypothetical protein